MGHLKLPSSGCAYIFFIFPQPICSFWRIGLPACESSYELLCKMLTLFSLPVLFGIAAANLGSYQNFTQTCESVYSFGEEDRNISAVCSRDATVSHLDLNECIGNVQGQLVVSAQ